MIRVRRRGFTLLEVLVALAVLAVALGAAVKLAAGSADVAAELRDRAVAGWIASNRINELLLAGGWPETGRRDGETTMAERRWRWRQTVSATADGGLRRIQLQVSAADGANDSAPIAEQTAFIARPL